ncbi:MAG TPA: hypothetical protein VMB26_04350, partial [Candidatus Binataceae bacterium]|nr:hypothetical protein [Candidatus Binataceae bacterium]
MANAPRRRNSLSQPAKDIIERGRDLQEELIATIATGQKQERDQPVVASHDDQSSVVANGAGNNRDSAVPRIAPNGGVGATKTAELDRNTTEADVAARRDTLPGSGPTAVAEAVGGALAEAVHGVPQAHTKPAIDFRYHIDSASPEGIEGWLMTPDEPTRHFVVVLKEDNQIHARIVASRFREDLVVAGIGDGCYAFELPMPRTLQDGAEHIVELVEEETGFSLTDEPILLRSALAPGMRGPGYDKQRGSIRALPASKLSYPASPRGDARILFDISDLIYY